MRPLSWQRLLSLTAAFSLGTLSASAQTAIALANPTFDPIGGRISGMLDLNVLDGAPSNVTLPLGSSGWYGQAQAATLANLGFRAGIEVDYSAASAGAGYISYTLGASLGGLLGLEMPEAYLWQPLAGWALSANKTYIFTLELDAGRLLDATALFSRGVGIGITTGSTASSVGSFVADTITTPALLQVTSLGGTVERLTMAFTTGSTPPAGDLGVAFFGGRGTQALQLALLDSYRVDNASLTVVPEPSAALSLIFGAGLLLLRRRRGSGWRARISLG